MRPLPSANRRLLTMVLVAAFGSAAPVFGAHRARLSADLEDHVRAGSAAVDVIVHGTRGEVEALAARYNLTLVKYLKHGAVLRGAGGDIAALQQDEAVDHLSADIRYRSSGDITTESIGADQVWAGSAKSAGLSGRGIGVAVIDSGVDPKHAALRGRIAASVDFTGGDGIDTFGHGTHVAAIIAGGAGRLVETQDYGGVAPGARIVNLRVLGADGSGLASDVIEAIDWAIDNRKAYDIQVINLSLGAPVTQPYRDDPVCEAVQRAVAAGIVVVAAAGNFGRSADGRTVYGGITSPANDPHVITVGAVDLHGTAVRSDDTVAPYSSRGPTRYDLVLKPDLVAPGSRVVSAEAAGSYLAATYPARHVAGAGEDAYLQLSGTSMAAGVVSGAVALLLEGKPKLTPRDAKTILQLTSEWMTGEGLLASGTGSLNVIAAVMLVATTPQTAPITSEIARESITSARAFTITDGGDYARRGRFSVLEKSKLGTDIYRLVTSRLSSDSILWGNCIVWGNSIVWGNTDSIVWGNGDSIVWGNTDSIVWGNADSIVWGNADSIVWGNADSIVWGNTDSIVWDNTDSIVWGNDDSIVWGNVSPGGLD